MPSRARSRLSKLGRSRSPRHFRPAPLTLWLELDVDGFELATGLETPPVAVATAGMVVAVPASVAVACPLLAVWVADPEAEAEPSEEPEDATKGLDELPPVPVVRSRLNWPVPSC